MQRILHIPMSAELVLHVGVAQDAHLRVELTAVDAEDAAVELQWGEEGEGFGEAGFGAHC
jgi:hypothetical protein